MAIHRIPLLFTIALIFTACNQSPATRVPANPNRDKQFELTGDQKVDWAKILQLEEQAKAIANKDGCSSDSECRTAPVGSRGCGGPRYYLVYCARTTDSVALFKKLDEVSHAEQAYNAKYRLVSTCEMRLAPKVGITAGACQAR